MEERDYDGYLLRYQDAVNGIGRLELSDSHLNMWTVNTHTTNITPDTHIGFASGSGSQDEVVKTIDERLDSLETKMDKIIKMLDLRLQSKDIDILDEITEVNGDNA